MFGFDKYMKMKTAIYRAVALMLVVIILSASIQVKTAASIVEESATTKTSSATSEVTIVEELFGFSMYHFHYVNENGDKKEDTTYKWGSSGAEGLNLSRTDLSDINIQIDADSNELYAKHKPVLMWVHKGDALFDPIYLGEPPAEWYEKKLQQTYLIYALPGGGQDVDITVNVPMRLNIGADGIGGLIDGGYYEIEFYTEDAIPEILKFAYEMQTYSLEELEKYIEQDMNETIKDYYNIDSGFDVHKDALPFKNSDLDPTSGICAGYSSLASGKYNGVNIPSEFRFGGTNYIIDGESGVYPWYENVYGSGNLHDVVLGDEFFMKSNTPTMSMVSDSVARAYPTAAYYRNYPDVDAFYALIKTLSNKVNLISCLKGNTGSFENLDNAWLILDSVAAELRQKKTVIVNVSERGGGGHALVGYKMEQIDDETVRLYCYDCNFPDDMAMHVIEGKEESYHVVKGNDNYYENIVYKPYDGGIYIDFKKVTKTSYKNGKKREIEYFTFDSSHTSFNTNSEDGVICFVKYKGGTDVGMINYDVQTNEVLCYRAFPVYVDDTTINIRTFAFYKSGKVVEVTDMAYTNLVMDYSFMTMYKIKGSSIILKNGYKVDNESPNYIDCYVSYEGPYGQDGKVLVRIAVSK